MAILRHTFVGGPAQPAIRVQRSARLRWRIPGSLLLGVALCVLPATAAALVGQTITFNAVANQTFGGPPFIVSATASSGLPVAFASLTTTTCTVNAITGGVSLVAAGTCTIQASQSGNATYAAAAPVSRSFTIAKAAQTITFSALPAKTYGNPPFNVAATASSGLPVTFTSTTTTICTATNTTVTILAGGTCTIRASQAGNGNYLAAPNISQSVVVAKAAQTISFPTPQNAVFGASPFVVTATASSGLAVAFTSTTTGICTIAAGTVTIRAAGTCTIQANQTGNANYLAATAVSRSVAVAKASQTISLASIAARRMDQSPVTAVVSASSGLAVALTSTTTSICTTSGTSVTLRSIGTCVINATQAGNANFLAAAPVATSFVVSTGNQTITFGPLGNKLRSDPAFTVTATSSAGLPIQFVALTPACSISGRTVTLLDVGPCTIRANQYGSPSWNAAIPVDQSFAIRGPQTTTFDPVGDSALGSAVSLSAISTSSLAVSFSSLTPAVCSVTNSTATLLALGVCTVRASQPGDAYYLPADPVDVSFNVLRAQTITFAPVPNKPLGTLPFVVTGTASSGLPVLLESMTQSVCMVGPGDVVTLLSAGTCTIRAMQFGDATYAMAPIVFRSFVVGPMPTLKYYYDGAGNVTRIERN